MKLLKTFQITLPFTDIFVYFLVTRSLRRLMGNIPTHVFMRAINVRIEIEFNARAMSLAMLGTHANQIIAETNEEYRPARNNDRRHSIAETSQAQVNNNNEDLIDRSQEPAVATRSRRFSTSVVPTRPPFFTRGRRPSTEASLASRKATHNVGSEIGCGSSTIRHHEQPNQKTVPSNSQTNEATPSTSVSEILDCF